MPMMRLVHDDDGNALDAPLPSLRFPVELRSAASSEDAMTVDTDDLFEAMDNVSRRIDDLARELNCLGWFDDDNPPPRAA